MAMPGKIFLVFLAVLATTAVVGCAVVTQPLVSAIPSQPPAVDAARLEAHVKHLSVDLYPRSAERSYNLGQAAKYIYDEFAQTGAQVSYQVFTVQEASYKNVIVRFGPATGPVRVIGAHYDSHGDAQRGARDPRGYTPDTHTPGADDNASGVAGLIELAYLLGKNPPSHPVELVAYTTEEPPYFRTEHMGSAVHAQSLVDAKREVDYMVSLEMIGYFSDEPGSQHFPLPGMSALYSDRGNFIALVGKMSDFGFMRQSKALMKGATDLPVESINAPPLLPGIDFSDHLNYWQAGYRALMVTDTAFMRNQQYHLAGDTWDKLDYVRMAKVVRGVYALVQAP